MWSEELQQQTREFFKKWPMAMMKHFGDMKFGVCHVKDGRYLIEGIGDAVGQRWEYASVDMMIADGWAID